jgi:hypothetical protein
MGATGQARRQGKRNEIPRRCPNDYVAFLRQLQETMSLVFHIPHIRSTLADPKQRSLPLLSCRFVLTQASGHLS